MKALPAICLFAAALASSAAMAHAVVRQSSPAHGARLREAPKEVVIVFNESVEKMFTNATLRNQIGATVPTMKATIDPDNPAKLHLAMPPLAPGAYVVRWTAVGQDGHRRTGDVGFTIN
jgi:methionine-rich copper-binding protein CopC